VTAFDPVLLEILRNRFQAAAEEMASVVLRTGHTVFVKETGDFGAALVSAGGEVFAAPVNTGVSLMVGHPFQEVVRKIRFDEGDIFITNDPQSTGGMATHLPDVYLWKPIYYKGEFVCFSWSFIHSSDVGGRVPGSIAPSNTEIFQEGLVLPPSKLYRQGMLNEEIRDIFLSNCRIPEQNWGDIKALMTGLNTAEARMQRLLDTYGLDGVRDGIDAVLDYAEAQARAAIRDLPNGSYEFHDYMEGDVAPGGHPVRIKLIMHIEDEDIVLDFHGTDPWVNAAINMPTHSKNGHWMIAFALISFLRSTRPEILFNSGMVRPIHLDIPKGAFLNPPPRAAVGVRAATMFRVFDTVMGALTQAVPELLPAAGSSQGSILLVSAPDVMTGETKVSVVQPLCGGSGGRPSKDGTDGVDTAMGFLRNIPVESIESDIPILITRYKLRENSGGPGRFRGGIGTELGFRVLGAQATITSRGMERYRFAPWGRDNGRPGTIGTTTVNPGRADEREIGKIDVLVLNPGEELLIRTQGGGGFGSPFERDPEDVLRDVRDMLVSVEQAASDYGVVIRDGEIDAESTARLRAGREPEPFARITYDPDRVAYDATWTDDLRVAVNETTGRLHGALRHIARSKLMVRIDERAVSGVSTTVADVGPLYQEVLADLGLTGFVELAGAAD
jgi:N-methylhydantoinase B